MLALERGLRRKDPLGEVFRGIGVGCTEFGLRGSASFGRLTKTLAALPAGPRSRPVRLSTVRAGRVQAHPALVAERGLGSVLVLAARTTDHARSLLSGEAQPSRNW